MDDKEFLNELEKKLEQERETEVKAITEELEKQTDISDDKEATDIKEKKEGEHTEETDKKGEEPENGTEEGVKQPEKGKEPEHVEEAEKEKEPEHVEEAEKEKKPEYTEETGQEALREVEEVKPEEAEELKDYSREARAERLLKKVEEQNKERAEKGIISEEKDGFRKSRRRKKGSGKAALIAAAAIVGILAVGGGYYVYEGQKYKTVFFPGTMINGIDASGMTVAQVEAAIAAEINGYTLIIEERGNKSETISGDQIQLKPEFDGSLGQMIAAQKPLSWLPAKMQGNTAEIKTQVSYDEKLLEEAVDSLDCMDEAQMTAPVSAYVSQYTPGTGFAVVPEEQGTALNRDMTVKVIGQAAVGLQPRVSLEENSCYLAPTVTKEDEQLKAVVDEMNKYANMTITYQFGDARETLSGDIIAGWLSTDGITVDISSEKAGEYVKSLAEKYDTAYKPKTLKTSYGPTVTITKGHYGWRINQGEETAQLLAAIGTGESQEREPVYSQTAASRGENDYGDTYVEINLTAQHLYFYKNGEKLIESDFVSGNVSKNYTTPPGAYPLTYKQRNAILRGEGYASPVSYWMPFNGGIGMHDANWRSSFGGTIYKTSGSHGCINLPPAVAKTIYENISQGMPVLCYNLEGTESKGSSVKPAQPTQPETESSAAAEQPTEGQPSQPESNPAEQPAQPAEQPSQEPTQAETESSAPTEAPTGPGDQVGQQPSQEVSGPGAGM